MSELHFHKGRRIGDEGRFVIESEQPLNKPNANLEGEVYLATDTRLHNRPVAIKFLKPSILEDDPRILESFQLQIKVLVELKHPNIINIIDYGKETDDSGATTLYFVMEYIPQDDAVKKSLSIPQVIEVGILVCKALTATHKKGILHRDVKYDNILIALEDEELTVKLADFGIVKLAESERLTSFGISSQQGTPAYSPPEQYSQTRPLKACSDIYSLAKSLFTFLTGKIPETLVQLSSLNFPTDRNIPPKLVDLLIESTAVSMDERPPSAKAFRERLEDILGSLPYAEGSPGRSIILKYRRSTRSKPTLGRYVLILGALAAITLGGYILTANLSHVKDIVRETDSALSVSPPAANAGEVQRWAADREWAKILDWSRGKSVAEMGDAAHYLAVARMETGQADEGIQLMTAYAELVNTAEAWINAGRSALRFDRREAAAEAYRRVLKLNPENSEARERLARLVEDGGKK